MIRECFMGLIHRFSLGVAVVMSQVQGVAQSLSYVGNFPTGPDFVLEGAGIRNGLWGHNSLENPILNAKNIYAPDFIRNGTWNIYFGGWWNQGDVNDRVYLMVADDFAPEGYWSGPAVMVDHGGYLNVNDPSVRKLSEGLWIMAYTTQLLIGAGYREWINVSVSADGALWFPNVANITTEVGFTNMNFSDCARPAVLWTGDRYRMWFDAYINDTNPHSYLAESFPSNPLSFTVIHTYPDLPGPRPGFFEPDVELLATGNPASPWLYVAVINHDFTKIVKYTSVDGINFTEAGGAGNGTIMNVSDPTFRTATIHNPGIVYDNFDGTLQGVRGYAYGMGPIVLNRNDIGFCYPQYRVELLSCPTVWHQHQYGRYFEEAIVSMYQYSTYCRIRVTDPLTSTMLIDQSVTGMRGDRWRLTWP